jgi:hypothetical protein
MVHLESLRKRSKRIFDVDIRKSPRSEYNQMTLTCSFFVPYDSGMGKNVAGTKETIDELYEKVIGKGLTFPYKVDQQVLKGDKKNPLLLKDFDNPLRIIKGNITILCVIIRYCPYNAY